MWPMNAKKRWRPPSKTNKKALEAQIQEQDKILTTQWMQKEAETITQLGQHYKQKEVELHDRVKKQLETEISRHTHILEERMARDAASAS